MQPATPYTRRITKNVYIPVMTQHAAQVRKKHQTESQVNRKEMGLREHAGREPACRNWFRELRLSFRWWTVVWQDVAVNDACVLPGGKNTCP